MTNGKFFVTTKDYIEARYGDFERLLIDLSNDGSLIED